jgi:hypothetical protein
MTAATITTLDYLRALYPPGTPGELLAYCKKPFIRRFGTINRIEHFAGEIRKLDGVPRYDMYQTINTLDGDSIRSRGQHGRGKESEVVAVPALVADVDAAPKDGHNYPPQSVILDTLADMPLTASMVVVSGRPDGGLHVYWLFHKPFIIGSDADRKRIKAVSKGWQGLLKAKLKPYDLDSTFDLVRVLRPVGTENKKYGTIVQAVAFEPDRRYTLADFEWSLPAASAPRTMSASTTAANPGDVLAQARAHVAKIPGAVSGQDGHKRTYRVAAVLVLDFNLSVAQAMPIMQAWNATCDPPWTEAELLHKLESADGSNDPRGKLLQDYRHDVDISAIAGPVVTRLVLAQEASWL